LRDKVVKTFTGSSNNYFGSSSSKSPSTSRSPIRSPLRETKNPTMNIEAMAQAMDRLRKNAMRESGSVDSDSEADEE